MRAPSGFGRQPNVNLIPAFPKGEDFKDRSFRADREAVYD